MPEIMWYKAAFVYKDRAYNFLRMKAGRDRTKQSRPFQVRLCAAVLTCSLPAS